ncbi:hypothetical protein B296_00037527 [Ensete ventricosum]|uniref:Uncharacterized protein n=1 Tax=Ensete ventricosum TaxID=4639 RepID=A0A426ZVB8_ENSVE|nr:hypothetical protein B296_00037527 [Ensete ventricosum]
MLQSTGKGGGGSDWAILVAEEEGDSNREGTVLEQRWQRAGEKDVSNGSRGDGGSNWQYETRWQRDAIGSCNQGLEGNNDDNNMI